MSSSNKSTLKRQNTDDVERSAKKQKSVSDQIESEEEDDAKEENRAAWIQQQLDALQGNANQITSSTNSDPVRKSDPTSEDLWAKPCDGLEVFTSKGVISSDKVR
jgi:hypothetical protein